jgi:hypothetical protein
MNLTELLKENLSVFLCIALLLLFVVLIICIVSQIRIWSRNKSISEFRNCKMFFIDVQLLHIILPEALSTILKSKIYFLQTLLSFTAKISKTGKRQVVFVLSSLWLARLCIVHAYH